MNSIDNEVFNTVMCRDTRSLRDEILDMCCVHGISACGKTEQIEFKNKIINNYDPLNWEFATLYAHKNELINAIKRITSITKSKSKNKVDKSNVDWLDVARFESKLWIGEVIPREHNAVKPAVFDILRDKFREVYIMYTKWVLADFSYANLLKLFNMCNNFDSYMIVECMRKVDDPSKRSMEYLLPIIEKEIALKKCKLTENKELLDSTKQTLETMLSLVAQFDSTIDWKKIEETIKTNAANTEIFSKIKLS